MKPKKLLQFSLIIFMAAVFLHCEEAEAREVGKAAAGFALKDINGKTHNLSDYKGKIVVLEWINYDCPYVKKHYDSKNMQSLQKKYAAKGVTWLAINSSAEGKQGHFSSTTIKKRSSAHGAAFSAYLLDTSGTVGRQYGAKTTPHMYIIGKDGTLLYKGGIDSIRSTDVDDIAKAENYVSRALDEILAEKKVSKASTKPYGCSVKY